eukprot:757323_1
MNPSSVLFTNESPTVVHDITILSINNTIFARVDDIKIKQWTAKQLLSEYECVYYTRNNAPRAHSQCWNGALAATYRNKRSVFISIKALIQSAFIEYCNQLNPSPIKSTFITWLQHHPIPHTSNPQFHTQIDPSKCVLCIKSVPKYSHSRIDRMCKKSGFGKMLLAYQNQKTHKIGHLEINNLYLRYGADTATVLQHRICTDVVRLHASHFKCEWVSISEYESRCNFPRITQIIQLVMEAKLTKKRDLNRLEKLTKKSDCFFLFLEALCVMINSANADEREIAMIVLNHLVRISPFDLNTSPSIKRIQSALLQSLPFRLSPHRKNRMFERGAVASVNLLCIALLAKHTNWPELGQSMYQLATSHYSMDAVTLLRLIQQLSENDLGDVIEAIPLKALIHSALVHNKTALQTSAIKTFAVVLTNGHGASIVSLLPSVVNAIVCIGDDEIHREMIIELNSIYEFDDGLFTEGVKQIANAFVTNIECQKYSIQTRLALIDFLNKLIHGASDKLGHGSMRAICDDILSRCHLMLSFNDDEGDLGAELFCMFMRNYPPTLSIEMMIEPLLIFEDTTDIVISLKMLYLADIYGRLRDPRWQTLLKVALAKCGSPRGIDVVFDAFEKHLNRAVIESLNFDDMEWEVDDEANQVMQCNADTNPEWANQIYVSRCKPRAQSRLSPLWSPQV